MGRVTRYEYTVAGQLAAVVDAAGGRTEFAYDQLGNKVSQRDALGRVTRFEYDVLGRETARVLPGGQLLLPRLVRDTHTLVVDEAGRAFTGRT
jgi:YD repeat-containing protein